MKTLSRTFAFILLAIVAVVTFMSCATKVGIYTYERKIGDPNHYLTFKKGDDNESDFRRALIALKNNTPPGACEITFLHTGPRHTPEPHHYRDICEHGGTVNLKTDRVIKSKTASNTAVGQPAANDPNVTWRIMSNYQGDIDAVMNTLNP
jgi:hypothetical protein